MGMHANKYSTFNINESTPVALYNALHEEFNFNFDPCPLNPAWEISGLEIDWGKRCFINPPYGREIIKWLEKALDELSKKNTETAVFLLPAYTDVRWFHDIVLHKAHEIRFIKGRLKFGEHKGRAPFGSMIVVFKGDR